MYVRMEKKRSMLESHAVANAPLSWWQCCSYSRGNIMSGHVTLLPAFSTNQGITMHFGDFIAITMVVDPPLLGSIHHPRSCFSYGWPLNIVPCGFLIDIIENFQKKKKTKLHISPTMLNSRKHPIIGLFFLNNIQSKWHQEREREAARFRIGADFQFKLSGWLLIADRWSHCPIMRSLARALQTSDKFKIYFYSDMIIYIKLKK